MVTPRERLADTLRELMQLCSNTRKTADVKVLNFVASVGPYISTRVCHCLSTNPAKLGRDQLLITTMKEGLCFNALVFLYMSKTS